MSRKRLLRILAVALLALTLGRIVPADHIQGALASGLEIISGNDRSLAEGPVDEPPTIPQGLAEGPIEDPPTGRPGLAEGPTDDIPPTPPGLAAIHLEDVIVSSY